MTHRPDIDTARHPSSANLCADHSDTAADIGTGIRYEIASTELTASQFEMVSNGDTLAVEGLPRFMLHLAAGEDATEWREDGLRSFGEIKQKFGGAVMRFVDTDAQPLHVVWLEMPRDGSYARKAYRTVNRSGEIEYRMVSVRALPG